MRFDLERAGEAEKWLRYARDFNGKNDPYGEFFAAWVGLVIIGKDYLDHYQPEIRVDGDRQPLTCLFDHEEDLILRAVRSSSLASHRDRLSRRRDGDIILMKNAGSFEKAVIRDLSEAWPGGRFIGTRSSDLRNKQSRPRPVPSETTAILELLLQIRNGLFHGSKKYNDGTTNRFDDDKSLLTDVNPIIGAIADEVLNARS